MQLIYHFITSKEVMFPVALSVASYTPLLRKLWKDFHEIFRMYWGCHEEQIFRFWWWSSRIFQSCNLLWSGTDTDWNKQTKQRTEEVPYSSNFHKIHLLSFELQLLITSFFYSHHGNLVSKCVQQTYHHLDTSLIHPVTTDDAHNLRLVHTSP